MPIDNKGATGTTDQRPTWEGPPENRPRGYLPPDDNPEVDRDAAGENLNDPDESDLSDAVATRDFQPSRDDRIRTRAHRLWEQSGQQHGSHEDHWFQAERDIDEEEDRRSDTTNAAASGQDDRRPAEEFPPFDDPAFSPKPAQPPVRLAGPAEPMTGARYASHPEFSQYGAPEPPRTSTPGRRDTSSPGTEKTSGAGPAIAQRSKDAQAPKPAPQQPGASAKE